MLQVGDELVAVAFRENWRLSEGLFEEFQEYWRLLEEPFEEFQEYWRLSEEPFEHPIYH